VGIGRVGGTEAELAGYRPVSELLRKMVPPPKAWLEAIGVKLVQIASRTGGSPARSILHVIFSDAIREIHITSRGTYGVRRIHARANARPWTDRLAGDGVDAHAGNWAKGHLRTAEVASAAPGPNLHGHGQSPVHPKGSNSGFRTLPSTRPARQDPLRRRPRCLTAPGRGLVHRLVTDRSRGHKTPWACPSVSGHGKLPIGGHRTACWWP
jgi:hypothetical protein